MARPPRLLQVGGHRRRDPLPPHARPDGRRGLRTIFDDGGTAGRTRPGRPEGELMDFGFDARTAELHEAVNDFLVEFVYPAETVLPEQARAAAGGGGGGR